MKKRFLAFVVPCLSLTGCRFSLNLFNKPDVIKEANQTFRRVLNVSTEANTLKNALNEFGADFSYKAFETLTDISKNNVVSPISMFSALSVAAECSANNTQSEILNALHTDLSSLASEFPKLYSAANVTRAVGSKDNKIYKKEVLTNSIWLDKNISFKQSMVDKIAEDFYCYSMNADFSHNNAKTNKQMSNFVKDKTEGLLSPKFSFDENTYFTILNTLYFKSLWNIYADDIEKSNKDYDFTNRDRSKTSQRLFKISLEVGKVLEGENYSSFFAKTCSGDKIKFIVPNDGVSLENVINRDSILNVINADYEGIDEANNICYRNTVYFPGFEAEQKLESNNVLKTLGINDLFTDKCDFSGLTDEKVICGEIEHVAKLKVDKKGIEGAAYTVMPMNGTSGPGPEPTYIDGEFIVDKAFYYVVCDSNNLPLFSGVVNKI